METVVGTALGSANCRSGCSKRFFNFEGTCEVKSDGYKSLSGVALGRMKSSRFRTAGPGLLCLGVEGWGDGSTVSRCGGSSLKFQLPGTGTYFTSLG
jgi:hypothetical protein